MSERPRLRVVSLFCGIGGWDLGLYAAGEALGASVEVVAAYDSWDRAVACYNANLPHPVAVVRDLKTMQRAELPPHDLVIGGPPCQPFSMAGKRQGHSDERNCLPYFVRLAGDSPYVMENVVSRLINAPWSEKLCAADFGDVTSRKRWFYSNYLMHIIQTPGPRRIRDIRDHAEDERVLKKRGLTDDPCCKYPHTHYDENSSLATVRAKTDNAPDGRGWEKRITCKAGALGHYDSLGSVLSNSFHVNEASRIVACRNPSLLEMARAHSIPDDFDWCGATKSDRGCMIANSVPCGLAAGVSSAILRALISESTIERAIQ